MKFDGTCPLYHEDVEKRIGAFLQSALCLSLSLGVRVVLFGVVLLFFCSLVLPFGFFFDRIAVVVIPVFVALFLTCDSNIVPWKFHSSCSKG